MDKKNAIKLLDETFNNDFNNENFFKFIKELFNKFLISKRDCTQYISKEYLEYINSFEKIGDYKDNSGKEIEVLIVKLNKTSSRDRARTMQRNFISNWLGKTEKDAALVAFYGDDPQDWRFSFVKMEYNLVKDEKGKTKISKELTPAKRYSFLVGKNEPNHTCASQFIDLIVQEEKDPSIEEIEFAFGIEKVTKEFFDKYKRLFLDLKESLDKIIKRDKTVKEEFEKKGIDPIDFTKKLLGQIVFLYFLQKKGWLGVEKGEDGRFKAWGTGPKNFMKKLFEGEIRPYKNFYNDILEPLFYEALATERYDDYYTHFKCKIPFLNGGLFEPIKDYNWRETDILLDNKIFEDIFKTFDEFNFTVKEDEPLEKEVAVDPEMLGKVFENLLEVKDRKSKGAFYTPREIVHYMCQQSLINYLETNTSISREDLEKFIQLGDFALDVIIKEQEQIKKYGRSYIEDKFTIPKSVRENHKEIDSLLKEIKVVDPAVGSGAFPVGMMNEIVKARSILSIYFKENRKDYDLKREIIENCLYGVDIESSAVEITKLRFWLSLIVDELDMKNIKPLPNLDHKIMCGNSLLEEFEGIKLFNEKLLGGVKRDNSFEIKRIEEDINRLYQELGKIHTGKQKDQNGRSKEVNREIKKLQRQRNEIAHGQKIKEDRNQTLDEATENRIKESQKKLAEHKRLQNEFFNEQNKKKKKELKEDIDRIEWELIEETLKEQGNESAIQKLEQYKKNKAKPFFLWKLYFSDVFQRDNPGFDVVIGNPPYVDYREIDTETRNGTKEFKLNFKSQRPNLYYFFIEKGHNILKEGGCLSFINPNQFLSIDAGFGLRNFLLNNGIIQFIVDVSYVKVFAEAATYTCVWSFVKKVAEDYSVDIGRCKKLDELDARIFSISKKEICSEKDLRITINPNYKLITKIQEDATPLSKFGDLKWGTSASGYGKKKILVKDYLELNDAQKNKYTPLIQTRDIKKFYIDWQGEYIPTNIYSQKIKNDFIKEKIVIARVTKKIQATLDIKKFYVGKSTLIVDLKETPNYLLGIINSKLILYWYYSKFETTHMAGGYLRFDIPYLSQIPIKNNGKLSEKIKQLVDQILSLTKNDDYLNNPDKQSKVKILEKEIDQLVYKLYELTPEEIKIVEEFNKE